MTLYPYNNSLFGFLLETGAMSVLAHLSVTLSPLTLVLAFSLPLQISPAAKSPAAFAFGWESNFCQERQPQNRPINSNRSIAITRITHRPANTVGVEVKQSTMCSRSGAIFSQAEREDGGFELSLHAAGPNPVHFVRARPFAAVIPGDNVAGGVITTGITSFLNLYNAALIGRLILTWFPNPPQVILNPLATVCDPYLNLFRGIIPPLGGTIDLSPILAFITLDLFTNSATALSAEIGPDGQMVRRERSGLSLSKCKEAWRRRVEGTAERRRREAGSSR